MSSGTALIVDAAIQWYSRIKDEPKNWADDKDMALIRSVEWYLDVRKWVTLDE